MPSLPSKIGGRGDDEKAVIIGLGLYPNLNRGYYFLIKETTQQQKPSAENNRS